MAPGPPLPYIIGFDENNNNHMEFSDSINVLLIYVRNFTKALPQSAQKMDQPPYGFPKRYQ